MVSVVLNCTYLKKCSDFHQSDPPFSLKPLIFFISDHTCLMLFSFSFFSVHLLVLCYFLFELFLYTAQKLTVSLPEASFFHVQKFFQVTGDPVLIIVEALHCLCGDDVLHTEVYLPNNVIFMWLIEYIPVCHLKAPLKSFLIFLRPFPQVFMVKGCYDVGFGQTSITLRAVVV